MTRVYFDSRIQKLKNCSFTCHKFQRNLQRQYEKHYPANEHSKKKDDAILTARFTPTLNISSFLILHLLKTLCHFCSIIVCTKNLCRKLLTLDIN